MSPEEGDSIFGPSLLGSVFVNGSLSDTLSPTTAVAGVPRHSKGTHDSVYRIHRGLKFLKKELATFSFIAPGQHSSPTPCS
jgi:hypothetical protein